MQLNRGTQGFGTGRQLWHASLWGNLCAPRTLFCSPHRSLSGQMLHKLLADFWSASHVLCHTGCMADRGASHQCEERPPP